MPLLAILAVMLCSALVLTTWSIIGGFLVMLLKIGREMEGDVSISWPTVGFAHYERLIERLEADPMIDAACPVIETFGVIVLPDDRQFGVKIKGIDAASPRLRRTSNRSGGSRSPSRCPRTASARMSASTRNGGCARAGCQRRWPHRRGGDRAYRPWEQMLAEGLSLRERDPMTGAWCPRWFLASNCRDSASGFPTEPMPADIAGRRVSEGGFAIKSGFIPNGSVTLTVLPMGPSGRAWRVSARCRSPTSSEPACTRRTRTPCSSGWRNSSGC